MNRTPAEQINDLSVYLEAAQKQLSELGCGPLTFEDPTEKLDPNQLVEAATLNLHVVDDALNRLHEELACGFGPMPQGSLGYEVKAQFLREWNSRRAEGL